MKAILSRRYTNTQTFGRLILLDGERVRLQILTLELPWNGNQRRVSCIPEGKYEVHKIFSPKFGKCFLVNNVPDRDGILFHAGNYIDLKAGKVDSEGCILTGMAYEQLDGEGETEIVQSKHALTKMLNVADESFELHIV